MREALYQLNYVPILVRPWILGAFNKCQVEGFEPLTFRLQGGCSTN